MTIRFHISDNLLLKYSGGTLDEASGLLASTTAPMIAIRINTEVTSKGSRKS